MDPFYPGSNSLSTGFINYNASEISECYIRRVLLRESGTYNNQFVRSYTAHMSVGAINKIADYAAVKGSGAFSPANLAGDATSLISMSPVPTAQAGIANGWQQKRLIFILDVETKDISGASTAYLIQGYTDYNGFSLQSKMLDPNMVFYINNVVKRRVGARGNFLGSESEHVLYTTENSNAKVSGRPQDVYMVLQSDAVANTEGYFGSGQPVINHRNMITSMPRYSSRANNIASNYTSRLIQGVVGAADRTSIMSSPLDVYSEASVYIKEGDITTNPFLSLLAQSKRSGSSFSSGVFRWGDLLRIRKDLANPNCPDVNLITSGATSQTHMAGQTAEWNGASIETQYAAALSMAVASLMMECMIGRIVFSSTNHTNYLGSVSGITTLISHCETMNGTTGIEQGELFKRRLEMEVLKDISYSNQQKFQIEVRASCFGDTFISVSVDGMPSVDFTTPTFCDGLITPVLMKDYSSVQDLANGVESLVTEVLQNLHSRENERALYSPDYYQAPKVNTGMTIPGNSNITGSNSSGFEL